MANKIDAKMATLRKEYSELRKIGNKRLQRMGQSEFSWTKTYRKNFYQFYTKYRPLASLGNISKGDLAKLVRDLHQFIDSKESSVRGLQQIRRESLKTLDRNGYKFVTLSNYREWTEFMDWYRDKHVNNYGSPTREEMRTYLDNIKSGMTADEAKRLFERYENNKRR